jgi:hypothetical protein
MTPAIDQKLRLLERAIRRSRALRAAFRWSAVVAVVGLVAVSAAWFAGSPLAFWWVPAIVCSVFLVTVAVGFAQRIESRELLLWADRTFGLAERLSTLAEAHDSSNPFSEAIARDAETILSTVSSRNVAPVRIGISASFCIAAVLLAGGIGWIPAAVDAEDRSSFEVVLRTSTDRIEQHVDTLAELESNDPFARLWVEKVREKITELRDADPEQAAELVEELLRSVEAQAQRAEGTRADSAWVEELKSLFQELGAAGDALATSGAGTQSGDLLETAVRQNFVIPVSADSAAPEDARGARGTEGSDTEADAAPATGAPLELYADTWRPDSDEARRYPARVRECLNQYFGSDDSVRKGK